MDDKELKRIRIIGHAIKLKKHAGKYPVKSDDLDWWWIRAKEYLGSINPDDGMTKLDRTWILQHAREKSRKELKRMIYAKT